jgi:hypothetical protein
MTKNLPYILIGAGAGINVVNSITAGGDPSKGVFYGSSGILKPVNDALPINFGLALIIVGVVWLVIRFMR